MAKNAEIRFEKTNGEYLVTTRHAIENVLEGNCDNPDNPWIDASVDEVIEEVSHDVVFEFRRLERRNVHFDFS